MSKIEGWSIPQLGLGLVRSETRSLQNRAHMGWRAPGISWSDGSYESYSDASPILGVSVVRRLTNLSRRASSRERAPSSLGPYVPSVLNQATRNFEFL